VYRQQTAPLVELYRGRGLLAKVDAIGEIDHVTTRIITALAERDITQPDPASR
jgi:adenylate kinase